MEHVVPAQWTGEELTFELTLVICHGEKTCLVADAVDTGFCLPGLPSRSFWTSALWGSACLPFSIHVVCVGGPQNLAPGWLCDSGLANQSIACL